MGRVMLIVILFMFFACFQLKGYSSNLEEIKADLKENIEKGSVLGIGVMYPERPYKGIDEDVYVVPIGQLEYKRFFIDGGTFGYNLVNDDQIKFAVVGSTRVEGYDADDSPDLNGMDDRDWTVDMGLRLLLTKGVFSFTVSGLADPWDVHGGGELNSFVSAKLFDGFLRPRAGVRWLSEEVVNYYYGVRDSETTAVRPQYNPESTFNYVLGLTIGIPLKDRWALIGDIQYEFLGDQIKDSPIIDKDGIFRYVTGVVYRF